MAQLTMEYLEGEIYRECERVAKGDATIQQWHEGRIEMLKDILDDMLYDDDPKKIQLNRYIDRAMYLGRRNTLAKRGQI